MGLPALGITESMISELPDILKATGANVEQRPIDASRANAIKDSRLPNVNFFCSSPEGAVVLVRFGHAADIAPEGLAVVLQPVSASWWNWTMRKEKRLLKEIESILRRHGATDLVQGLSSK